MSDDENVFKAFSDFGADDIRPEAEVSRRMLRRLKDIETQPPQGPFPLLHGRRWHPASSHTPS
jgi:hypothetical protein